jgi:SAM-dependent methyltransferase
MSLSVMEVYDKIATEFDITRVRIWGSVKKFLDNISLDSFNFDNGCGNGKNMLYRTELKFKGIDISKEQVRICQNKGLDVIESSMTSLPFQDDEFDNMICIASYHHLDNDTDRKLALDEMYRCLKPGGKVLITVWAMEQFEGSTFHFTNRDEQVAWKSKDGNIYYRYYHIYNKGDIEEEVIRLQPKFKINEVGWEVGNWWIILEK